MMNRHGHVSTKYAFGGMLLLSLSQTGSAQDIIPRVLKVMPSFDGQNFPPGTFVQVGTALGETKYLRFSGFPGHGYGTAWMDHHYNGVDYSDSTHQDRWGAPTGAMGRTTSVTGAPYADGSGSSPNSWKPRHRLYSQSAPGELGEFQMIRVSIGPSPQDMTDWDIGSDGRDPAQVNDAPKISIGTPGPLGIEYGYMTFSQRNGSVGLSASGQISDTSGHPLNPFGLELQYDENGVRRTVPVAIGADGRFNVNMAMLMGSGGSTGRPLLLYHRTAGDEVNVGYYGNGTEFTRRSEVKEFQYDSLGNKVNEYIKSNGRFPLPKPNGSKGGVRG